MRKVILPPRALVEVTANREEEEKEKGNAANATASGKNVGGGKMETVVSEERDPRKERKRDGGQEPAGSAGKENIRSPFIFINKTSRRVKKRAGELGRRVSRASEQPSCRGRAGEGKGRKTRKKRDRCGEDSNGRATGSRRGGLRLFLNNNEMQSS